MSTQPPQPEREWWTPREVAERWRCDVSTIIRRCNSDSAFGNRLPGGWRIHRDAILALERREDRLDTQRQAARVSRSMRRAAAGSYVPVRDRMPDR